LEVKQVENNFKSEAEEPTSSELAGITSRRTFLKWSSAAALTAFAFGALNPEKLSAKMAFAGLPIDDDKSVVVDVGKGDIGVLNFAYANEQLESAFEIIIHRSAEILGVEIESTGANELARRSRGTPRIANRLLRRVRDYAEILGDGRITGAITQKGLDEMEVDRFGLDEVDRKLLLSIIEKFDGGPVGVGTISASISEDRESIEEVIEPYLIQIGFLNRTPRGRIVTDAAYKHFGYELPALEQARAIAS
jgi:hypothetical protein